jgi:hypothetical protein
VPHHGDGRAKVDEAHRRDADLKWQGKNVELSLA